jgi:hypothetical protein
VAKAGAAVAALTATGAAAGANDWPQLLQNDAPSVVAVPHLEQYMFVSSAPP